MSRTLQSWEPSFFLSLLTPLQAERLWPRYAAPSWPLLPSPKPRTSPGECFARDTLARSRED